MYRDNAPKPDLDWMRDAACRNKDTRIWFPSVGKGGRTGNTRHSQQTREALEVCQSCSVSSVCLEYSLHWEPYGTWGGKTEQERNGIRKRREIDLMRVKPRG